MAPPASGAMPVSLSRDVDRLTKHILTPCWNRLMKYILVMIEPVHQVHPHFLTVRLIKYILTFLISLFLRASLSRALETRGATGAALVSPLWLMQNAQ